MCNDSTNENGVEIGDPTETALINLGSRYGVEAASVRRQYPRIGELPFDSDRKMMSTRHLIDGEDRIIVKGAVDNLLERIERIWTKDELVPVEVKANKNRSKSLRKLIDNESYSDIKWGIKLADSNVGIENGIYTFPYFCSFLIKRYLAKRG